MCKNNTTNVNQDLRISDLQPGDILTYEASSDPKSRDIITEMIVLLTKSTITHSAIFIQDLDGDNSCYIADSGKSGTHEHVSIAGDSNTRATYVCRLNNPQNSDGLVNAKDTRPVIDAAKQIVSENLPYPFADLALVAAILLYKDVSHVNLKQAVVIKFLQLLTALVKKFIDDHRRDENKGKHTMVCSSYVYQCYLDASKTNPDLKIKIKGGDLQPGLLKTNKVTTLLDIFEEYAIEHNFKDTIKSYATETDVSVSEVEDVLKDMVDESNVDHVNMLKCNDLCNAIGDFLKTLYTAYGYAISSIKELIDIARKEQALFVTPNDLCNHIENAKKLGITRLRRQDEDLDENELPIAKG